MTLGKLPSGKLEVGDYVVWEGGDRHPSDSPSAIDAVAHGTPGQVVTLDRGSGGGSVRVEFAGDHPVNTERLYWCRASDLRVIDEREYLTRVAAAALIPEIGQ